MNRKIVGFDTDAQSDWVAQLECGHRQHVRHNPPLVSRPWVTTPEGRASRTGAELNCKLCDEVTLADSTSNADADVAETRQDCAAC
ncbi:MAG: DUF3565 domain-containing protein [Pyrinomonadaceae bacterium]|nr:DUF3565 domain-containing protein [Pyrinomonadaceae bacterium]